ncbi:MAG: ABC transporter permease [Bacteroidota bacterium]
MLKNQIISVWRSLRANFSYAIINTVGLILGITCSTVIYTFISYERSFDSFHHDSDNIYRIVQRNHTAEQTQYWNTTTYTLAKAIRSDFPEVQATQSAGPLTRLISSEVNDQVIRHEVERLLFVDFNYLQLFNFKNAYKGEDLWVEGSPSSAFDKLNSCVITQKLAQRYFPDAFRNRESLLGKTLLLSNKDPLEITGVVRNPPANTTLLFEMLVNYEFFAVNNPYFANNWSGNYQGYTYVKLNESTSWQNFEQDLETFKAKYLSEVDNKRIEYHLQAMSEIHTSDEYGTSIASYVVSAKMLSGLGAIGGLVLLIAIINYVNLATAQSLKRAKEIGVRKVLGSSRVDLFRQFIFETLLLTLVAILHAYALSDFILGSVNGYLSHLQLDLQLTQDTYWFLTLLLVVVTLLAGSYPAAVLSGYSPLRAIKSDIRKNYKSGSRNALVIGQFAVVQLLIVTTVITGRQMDLFFNKDMGFYHKGLLTVDVPDQSDKNLTTLKTKLERIAAIDQVSFASGIPLAPKRQYGTAFRFADQPAEEQQDAEMKVVGLDYLKMYELKLLAGRWLDQHNVTSDRSFNGFVVNETLVQSLGTTPEEIIGREIAINEGKATVVGVVADFHNMGLQLDITPCLMLYWQGFFSESGIRYQPGVDKNELVTDIEQVWKSVYPENIFKYQFVEDHMADNYRIEGLVFDAFKVSSFLAMVIGGLGLYGLISFIAEVRTREIGIRKTLGASVSGIVFMLSNYFLRLLLISIVIGSLAAWVITDGWLQAFAYKVEITHWYFVISAMLTVLMALLATTGKTLVTASMNPVESLRE